MDISKSEKIKLFYFEELNDVDDLKLLKKNAFRKAKTLLVEIKNNNCKCNLIQKWDELLDTLVKVLYMANFVKHTHPQKKFWRASEKISANTAQFVCRLYADKELYCILQNLKKRRGLAKTEPYDDYAINRVLSDFENAGMSSDEEARKRIVQLNAQIKKTEFYYIKGKVKKNCWEKLVSCKFSYSKDELLYELLCERLELANLFGYSTYADFALKRSVAGTPDFVQKFLEGLSKTIKTKTFKKLSESIQSRGCTCPASVLNFVEVSSRVSNALKDFLITESGLKDYFSVDVCMDGLKLVFKSLFDISLEIVKENKVERGKLWPTDLKKYCVLEENEVIGYIYCKFLGNPHKNVTGQCFFLQGGRICDDSTYQKPVVVVSLNKPDSDITQPRLLDALEVKILFHEISHAIHFILSSTKYQCVDGVHSPVDLAEVPTKFMEYFASDSRIIQQFAKHYKTQEVIPGHLLEKMIKYYKKLNTLESFDWFFYSEFDQACHSLQFLNQPISELVNKIFGVPCTQMIDFTYLVVNYGAFIYKYLLGDAIASSIWHKYFKNDPLSLEAGKRFRSEFLALTAFKPPKDLVENYLQTKLTPEFLSDSLLKNL